MASEAAIEQAVSLMSAFAERTGVTGTAVPKRYLWTDAFAVCNFLGLARATRQERYTQFALTLVDQVHQVLGRHRADDAAAGWLSGLDEETGAAHPTLGALRIGKKFPERPVDEPLDEQREWDRDGQYFHYLTKWMLALDQVTRATGQAHFNVWARELASTAHRAFAYGRRGTRRMVWKMSTDLSRVLVSSMGQHDALDGWITSAQLQATATEIGTAPQGPDMSELVKDFSEMTENSTLLTGDPLGLGGLCTDAFRVRRLMKYGQFSQDPLLDQLLAVAQIGLGHYARQAELLQPAENRLAFRELGLAIGLKALASLERETEQEHSHTPADLRVLQRLSTIGRHRAIGLQIESFWLDAQHRETESWRDHHDINEVMLATCLQPEGFLGP